MGLETGFIQAKRKKQNIRVLSFCIYREGNYKNISPETSLLLVLYLFIEQLD